MAFIFVLDIVYLNAIIFKIYAVSVSNMAISVWFVYVVVCFVLMFY